MTRTSPTRIVLYVISALVLVYLILPVLIIAPISFSSARFLTFPPPSFSLRWYQQYFANPAWMQATRVLRLRVVCQQAPNPSSQSPHP